MKRWMLVAGVMVCAVLAGGNFVYADSSETLVSSSETWSYYDLGQEPPQQGGIVWNASGYNSGTWSTGPAKLGYGGDGEVTTVSYGPNSQNKYVTTYFRHSFSVTDNTAYESLLLRIIRDDGCVVYINGIEVARENINSGTVNYGDWANATVADADENTWHEYVISQPSECLVTGTNVIAVETHQVNATSSDLGMNIELLGNFPVPTVTLVSPVNGKTVNQTNVSFVCSATDQTGLSSVSLLIKEQGGQATFSGTSDTEDAMTRADYPTTNYNNSNPINVDGQNPHAHAVMKFLNVFGNNPGQVPLGSDISSATLRLYCINQSPNNLRLYRLTGNWQESTVTWNIAEALGYDTSFETTGDFSLTGWREIDVTGIVQLWSDGAANYGFMMRDSGTDGIDFHSSEMANPPELIINYGDDAWQAVDTESMSGTSDSVTLSATLVDGKSYLWNCSVTNTASLSSMADEDFSVSIDIHNPDDPTLITPADQGAIGIDQSSTTLQVNVTDPDSNTMDVTFYGRKKPSNDDSFTIVVLPDTQKYSESYPNTFTAQTQWIVDNKDDYNIVFVIHEGDLVEHYNNTTEWQNAVYSMSLLDGEVPYSVLPGNHDNNYGADSSYYNTYFPYTNYNTEPWWGGNYPSNLNDNNYQLLSIGDVDLIFFSFAYTPSTQALAWASNILTNTYPDYKCIFSTHGLIMPGDGSFVIDPGGDMEYVWDAMVANDNVYFALCGHEHGEFNESEEVNGRLVHRLLADYQSRSYGGNGWLRIMEFNPAEDTVYVTTYSPTLDEWERDSNSEFELYFPMVGFEEIGTYTNVTSGSDVWQSWQNLEAGEEYQWYVKATDSTGKTAQSPTWTFRVPERIFVSPSGDDSTGESWATAFNDLQDALAVTDTGDHLWIAAGTYKPDQGQGYTPGDRTARFEVKEGVHIYGGFAGTENPATFDLDDRDFVANETILSGDLDSDGIYMETDNSRNLLVCEYPAFAPVFDGLTVTGGYNNQWPYVGSALRINEGAGATVRNCNFINNLYSAVFTSHCSSEFDHCIFDYSRLETSNYEYNSEFSTVVKHCVFKNCEYDAFYDFRVNAELSNCLFYDNHISIFLDWPEPIVNVVNCTITDNEYGVMFDGSSQVFIKNSILWNNSYVFSSQADATVTNSCIQGGWPGTGNTYLDPIFMDPFNDDFRLQFTSPCVDTGNNSYVDAGEMDLDGNNRISDGDGDLVAIVDMGAYEHTPILVPQQYTQIQQAVDAAQDGDSILVSPGTYSGINCSYKELNIRSTNPYNWNTVASTTIDGSSTGVGVAIFGDGTPLKSVLSGFRIINAQYSVLCRISNNESEISWCIAENNAYGIISANGASATITNNYIRNNSGYGLYCQGQATVKNNMIYRNSIGAYLYGYSGNRPQFVNNTVAQNSSSGIYSSDGDVKNSIVWQNGSSYSDNMQGTYNSVSYSCIQGGFSGGYVIITADPYFIDPCSINDPDFHITNVSPCINQGDPCDIYTGQVDIDNEARIQNDIIDIGADEIEGFYYSAAPATHPGYAFTGSYVPAGGLNAQPLSRVCDRQICSADYEVGLFRKRQHVVDYF